MLISHSHRFVFVHPYKTGGVSVSRALEPYHDAELQARVGFRHATARELRAMFEQHNPEIGRYHWFACVRNPFDLHVSLWRWIASHTHPDQKNLASMDFPDYVQWLERVGWQRPAGFRTWGGKPTDGSARQPRYLTLCDFLCDDEGTLLVDQVLRVEQLQQDFAQLTDHLGLSADLPHVNTTEHAPYRSYYGNPERARIGAHHKDDLARFDYTF